jgi:tocopherol O-methyltransferase
MSSALTSRLQTADRTLAAEIREHYNNFAWLYRRFWGDHIHHGLFLKGDEPPEQAQIQMLEHCACLAGIQRGWRVLDVGCGHGATCVYLASQYGCESTGITVSDRQGELCEENAERAQVKAEFIVADAEAIEFPAAVFDCIWTMESSEHFADKAAYFRKAAQALRPGGMLLLAAWTGSMALTPVQHIAEEFLCPDLITADEYSALLRQAGLTVLQTEDLTAKVVRTWEIGRRRARAASALLKFFPPRVARFVDAMEYILEAYRTRDLHYSVLVARR